MRVDQLAGGGCGLCNSQRIDHDPTSVTTNERNIRDVIATHLVDARYDLKESVNIVESCLPPETGIDRVW
ncbi:unannotated protein [freshwater metagenome]|uniref:Unannotated protein n=1 Tax=freshwater metagenome TaxID=449393 RepID=A0A6J6R3I5_9ZZZZ